MKIFNIIQNPFNLLPPTLLLSLLLSTPTIQTRLGLIQIEQIIQDSMVLIPAGSYQMGKSDDKDLKRPGHTVYIPEYLTPSFRRSDPPVDKYGKIRLLR